jgi:hypothetical protein
MKDATKNCEKCEKPFVPKSNRAKYCAECAAREIKKADRLRKQKKA